jgi:aminoglycoside phosphotransferase (APT) family kinase protein
MDNSSAHPSPSRTANLAPEGLASALEPTPGYDRDRVEAWVEQNVTALKPPLRWTRLEGGHSNLTYMIEDSRGVQAVIRRPPMGELLPKAHDMGREWALITALGKTRVPVPKAIGFCEDPQVTGAHFYIMGLIDGHPLYRVEDTDRWVPMALRPRMAHSFIDVLAELHSVDPDSVGLSDLGKKEDYIGRQLKTWYRSWNASIQGAQLDDARAHWLQEFFLHNLPDQGPARIVHGDYGMHNCLVGPDGSIAAVVDWEISTLGDPLADLAYALNQWAEPGDPPPPRGLKPTAVPGFPTRRDLTLRYAERTGRDLSKLDYYIGFNHWKSSAIVHGVYARYLEGKKSTVGVDLAGLKQSIDRSLADAEQAVARL